MSTVQPIIPAVPFEVPIKVAVAVTYAAAAMVPARSGTVVSSMALTVTDPDGLNTVMQEAVGATNFILEVSLPGTYNLSLQGKDQRGRPVGKPATDSFTIEETGTVALSLPTAIKATVGAVAPAVRPAAVSQPATVAAPSSQGLNKPSFVPLGGQPISVVTMQPMARLP